jgi:hypothetical protein
MTTAPEAPCVLSGTKGPIFKTYGNLRTVLNVQPMSVTTKAATGTRTLLVVVAFIAVLVVIGVVVLVRRGERPEEI